MAAPVFPNTLVQFAQPFSPTLQPAVAVHVTLDWAPVAIGVVWVFGFLAIMLARCRSWLGFRTALRNSTPIELPIPIPALITPGAEEPGVVGFLRPVLVLPAHLLEHLNPRQLGAILTHELCHVRRRDNLFAGVHMMVEAIFWFHPLVWWIGARMVEERELACDEEVLRRGCEPADYVEGILKVCRLYSIAIPATLHFRRNGRGCEEASARDPCGEYCGRVKRSEKDDSDGDRPGGFGGAYSDWCSERARGPRSKRAWGCAEVRSRFDQAL